jgi:hypothetical protein
MNCRYREQTKRKHTLSQSRTRKMSFATFLLRWLFRKVALFTVGSILFSTLFFANFDYLLSRWLYAFWVLHVLYFSLSIDRAAGVSNNKNPESFLIWLFHGISFNGSIICVVVFNIVEFAYNTNFIAEFYPPTLTQTQVRIFMNLSVWSLLTPFCYRFTS